MLFAQAVQQVQEQVPLVTYVSTSLRTVLILFLLYYSIRFRNWLVLSIIAFSAVSLGYFIKTGTEDALWIDLGGQVIAFLLSYIIYEYMRMKNALRNTGYGTEPMLSIVLEGEGEAHIGKNLDGKVVAWSKGAQDLYGYTFEEMRDQSISKIFPEDKKQEYRHIMKNIAQGKDSYYRSERIDKHGNRIRVEVKVHPARNENGDIVGATAITRRLPDEPVKELKETVRNIKT